MAPVDLARKVRCREKPTPQDSQARREARHLRMWWSDPNTKTGMLNLRGQLADLDGALFENTINHLIEQMRPPKGQAWDTREHRAADALVQLCRRANEPCECDENRPVTPKRAPKPLLVVEVPVSGPATVAGIPLPDAVVEQLRANAIIEPVLVDDHGAPLTGRATVLGVVGEDRPRGALARRALSLRHLRPALRPPHPPPHTPLVGWQRRHLQPRRGVRGRRASPDAHPERSLGPGRQPQPARRLTPRPLRRPHRRRSPPLRAPATLTRRTLTPRRHQIELPHQHLDNRIATHGPTSPEPTPAQSRSVRCPRDRDTRANTGRLTDGSTAAAWRNVRRERAGDVAHGPPGHAIRGSRRPRPPCGVGARCRPNSAGSPRAGWPGRRTPSRRTGRAAR